MVTAYYKKSRFKQTAFYLKPFSVAYVINPRVAVICLENLNFWSEYVKN
jgi:hypothetical protein